MDSCSLSPLQGYKHGSDQLSACKANSKNGLVFLLLIVCGNAFEGIMFWGFDFGGIFAQMMNYSKAHVVMRMNHGR